MAWIDRMGLAQRVVIVAALGLALATVGTYVDGIGGSPASFGWSGYAPLTAASSLPGTGLPDWLRLVVWLVLIAVWAAGSIRMLRPARQPADRHPGELTVDRDR